MNFKNLHDNDDDNTDATRTIVFLYNSNYGIDRNNEVNNYDENDDEIMTIMMMIMINEILNIMVIITISL